MDDNKSCVAGDGQKTQSFEKFTREIKLKNIDEQERDTGQPSCSVSLIKAPPLPVRRQGGPSPH